MKINYEEFEKAINSIIEQDKYIDLLYDVTKGGLNLWENEKMATSDCLWHLLEYLTNDKEGWIGYWLYECDYGQDGENKIKEDGKYVPFTTIEDLWNVLVSREKGEKNE